jgi:hypothetical protein
LIRSGQSATGAIGNALAGEATLARLPVSGAASGSRGVRLRLVGMAIAESSEWKKKATPAAG